MPDLSTQLSLEQKREIKAFIEANSAQYTDFISMLWEVLGLSTEVGKDYHPTLNPNGYDSIELDAAIEAHDE